MDVTLVDMHNYTLVRMKTWYLQGRIKALGYLWHLILWLRWMSLLILVLTEQKQVRNSILLVLGCIVKQIPPFHTPTDIAKDVWRTETILMWIFTEEDYLYSHLSASSGYGSQWVSVLPGTAADFWPWFVIAVICDQGSWTLPVLKEVGGKSIQITGVYSLLIFTAYYSKQR